MAAITKKLKSAGPKGKSISLEILLRDFRIAPPDSNSRALKFLQRSLNPPCTWRVSNEICLEKSSNGPKALRSEMFERIEGALFYNMLTYMDIL